MGENWIDAVMRINEAIVRAEDRRNMQVAKLLTMITEGQDTVEDAGLLTSYVNSLVLLQTIQSQLLEAVRQ